MNRMQAMVYRSYGPPTEVLELDEIDRPIAGADELHGRRRAQPSSQFLHLKSGIIHCLGGCER